MKKLIVLTFGMLFMFSIQAVPCTAQFACADGSTIKCTGDSSCEAGVDSVICTNQDGTHSYVSC